MGLKEAADPNRMMKALQESEKKIRDLMESLPIGVSISTPGAKGSVVELNSALWKMFGYNSKEEFLKLPAFVHYYDPKDRGRFSEKLEHGPVKDYETRFKRKDGTVFWGSVTSIPRITEDGTAQFVSVVEDITERKQSEEAMQQVNRALKILSDCNQALVRATKELDLLNEMCLIIVQEGGYRLAWVGFAEQDEKKTVRPVAQAGYEEGYLDTVNITWADTEYGCGPTCKAIRTGKHSIIKNILTDPEYTRWCSEASRRGYVSSIALPLIVEDLTFGALNIYAAEPDAFAEEEVKLLTELAGDMAYGIMALRTRAEHDRMVEALKESQGYVRGLIEASLDALMTISTKGKIIDVNHTSELIIGEPREKIIGTEFSEYFADPDAANRDCMQVFSDKYVRNHPGDIKHRDGTITPVLCNASVYEDARGRIAGAFVAYRDISEYKRAEEEIKKLSSAVDQSIDGVAMAVLEPKLIYVNKAFAMMHGYSQEEMIGMKPADIYGEKQIDEFISILNQVKAEGSWMGEIAHVKKDGAPFPTFMSITLLKNDDGNPTSFLAITKDITERKTLENKLQQAQRMEAIGTLAGGIAHDFNNILSAITGYSEIALYHELPEGNPARYSIEQVLKASGRATALVQQILAFSRQKEQELKCVKVSPIVKEAIKLLRASLPTTVEIRRNITAEPDTVMGDPGQIHQVLMNLCTNAGHAMREKGGVLEVNLRNAECGLRPGEIENTSHRAGTADLEDDERHLAIDLAPGLYLKLTVSDTGKGMTPDILEHIFDPYFTTKAVGEGTGLGLSVVHGIIKSLGGMIDVESEPGKGTTFNVFLPSIGAGAETETEIREPVPTGNEHILFIDDEEALVDIGKRMLEGLGYKVTIRTSSIEALEAFRAQPEKFDLVITDMTMPNLTGDKLAGELMSIRPDIPIILCTGFSELITEEKAKSLGIRGFIMKPFVIREIAETIREGLEE